MVPPQLVAISSLYLSCTVKGASEIGTARPINHEMIAISVKLSVYIRSQFYLHLDSTVLDNMVHFVHLKFMNSS